MIKANHKGLEFGVGDSVRVWQKIREGTRTKDGEKVRLQAFEGTVIGLKGRDVNRTFVVRRIGANKIGIERIFPLFSPTLEKVEVVRKGLKGVKKAKLYYIRRKAKKEIEKVYSRTLAKKTS